MDRITALFKNLFDCRFDGGFGSWLCEYALAEAWTGATSARWSCAVIFPGLAVLSVWKCS
jgi:hypothetical protein